MKENNMEKISSNNNRNIPAESKENTSSLTGNTQEKDDLVKLIGKKKTKTHIPEKFLSELIKK
jgi:hypothetical protein